MAALRVNSKIGKTDSARWRTASADIIPHTINQGSPETEIQGNGLADIFTNMSNLISNHGSKIMSGVDAVGKIASAGKNVFEANKSYKEMNKAGEELEYIKKKKRETELRKRQEEAQEEKVDEDRRIKELLQKALGQATPQTSEGRFATSEGRFATPPAEKVTLRNS